MFSLLAIRELNDILSLTPLSRYRYRCDTTYEFVFVVDIRLLSDCIRRRKYLHYISHSLLADEQAVQIATLGSASWASKATHACLKNA